jgi:hypothetical protein
MLLESFERYVKIYFFVDDNDGNDDDDDNFYSLVHCLIFLCTDRDADCVREVAAVAAILTLTPIHNPNPYL